ncbi:MAG: phosphoribosyltransferase domain-containing protein [Parabacteroides sp.]|nr:phosphoribosyltransferase domain-containing protein [Parabacteroides sp.]
MPVAKTWSEVMKRFEEIRFDEPFDLIVAIANGGIIPAALLNQRLDVEMQLLKIRLRDASQQPMYEAPRLLAPVDFDYKGKTILLVDDRVKTGSTFQLALRLLEGAEKIKTFAVNGKADYALYNEPCFKFPWII